MRQTMPREELTPNESLGRAGRPGVDAAHTLEQQQPLADAGACMRPKPTRPLENLAHECWRLKGIAAAEGASLRRVGTRTTGLGPALAIAAALRVQPLDIAHEEPVMDIRQAPH